MTTLKSSDGKQYVLILTQEQAELLGTFRYSHVARNSPLYEVLRDLPIKSGHRFRVTTEDGSIFHELAPRWPSNRMQDMDFADLEARVGASVIFNPLEGRWARFAARRKAETKAAEIPPTGWIVQYNSGILGGSNRWRSLVGDGVGIANAVYTSRNEAYRQMRLRSKKWGFPLECYRVVPAATKDGPEKDRGFYTVEFFRKIERPLGWQRSRIIGLHGEFSTAEAANAAIATTLGDMPSSLERKSWRVKWHPSRA